MTIFYKKDVNIHGDQLSEDESKHCAQVLRHQKGDEILVFDGNGGKHRVALTQVSKSVCSFEVIDSELIRRKKFYTHLAIAPTKNADRMEWMKEKICELGVDEVSFLKTVHSERAKLRMDRLEKKAISAMKQSGSPFLIKLNELEGYDNFIENRLEEIKVIAHVDSSHKHISVHVSPNSRTLVLIGPEGDFSTDEVRKAKDSGFQAVSLGQNTLRTETAGFAACCMINFVNRF